ncbi:2624_t:CDS:2 [Ambispora gerdemannii]|uniref:2624_t:CDS:1 n=1 Tax=Ambispora gerdemannii TaxID=144530 RepID=A0A9N8VV63_9GLOM|nr:2624_t:CDS:2 [Ambispora gerdemannii]
MTQRAKAKTVAKQATTNEEHIRGTAKSRASFISYVESSLAAPSKRRKRHSSRKAVSLSTSSNHAETLYHNLQRRSRQSKGDINWPLCENARTRRNMQNQKSDEDNFT